MRVALRRVIVGSLVQDRMRSALAVLAIALGVALGFAVQMINATAVNELASSVQALSGDADLQVRGARAGFDEELYPALARRAEVAVASPVVEVDARIIGRDESLHIVGIDLFRAAEIQPALLPTATDRLDVLRPDRLFVSATASARLARHAGDDIDLQTGSRSVTLRIAGVLGSAVTQRMAVMDIAGVQSVFDRVGTLTRIDLRLRPGVDVDTFANTVRASLPAGVTVARPQASIAAGASLSRAYRVNLDVLALVALFTGGLLVFSTQALSVVRRRSQLALMRVLGLTRRELVLLLVGEGVLLGAAGSALGLAGGYALAVFALRTFGPDLGSGYFRGVAPHVIIDVWSAIAFLGLGLAASMLGSAVPAVEASRAEPASALKAGDEQRTFARLRSWRAGVVVLCLAGLCTLAPPIAELPIAGYVSIALMLIGTLMLLPRLAASTWQHMPGLRASGVRLALEQLRRAPGQASVSLASIVASIALMVSMAIMVHSFRESLQSWLERVLPADMYVRASPSGDTGYLGEAAQETIARVPGVRRVDFIREQQILLDSTRPRVVLLARDIDPTHADRLLALIDTVSVQEAAAPVWVNEAAAALYDWRTGQVITLPLAGRNVTFTVAGIWRDYARQQGAVAMERSRYVALTGDRAASNAAVWVERGADIAVVRDALAGVLSAAGADVDIALPDEIRSASLRAFDRTFAVTYALELAAVLIGLVGLSSAFGALVLARRREFGMLRHIGMLRRQIAVMLASEGLLVSVIGMAVGLSLGWLMSLVLIHVVNRQSFHWGMELSIPWLPLVAGTILVIILSIATAVVSGRAAMGQDAVHAVREDW